MTTAIEDSDDWLDIGGRRLPADFPVECRWVTPRLAIGSMIGTRRNMRRLREQGITHVLGLQAEFDDRAIAADTGIEVLQLAVPDHPARIPESLLRQALEQAPGILAAERTRLFVHCMAGRQRAPTFAYAVLRGLGWSATEARERILETDPRAQLAAESVQLVDDLVAAGETRPGGRR
jgi:hypothetical protein